MSEIATQKDALRAELLAVRRARTPEEKADADAAWCQGAAALLTPSMNIAAYNPLGSEPGGSAFVETLAAACKHLYLPISGGDGHLYWALYSGPESMQPGAWALPNQKASVPPVPSSLALTSYLPPQWPWILKGTA